MGSPDALERAVAIGRLLDVYGPLLPPRQRGLLELRLAEDMSFAELAEDAGITRQAAHDLVRRAAAALLRYEREVGLAARLDRLGTALARALRLLDGEGREGGRAAEARRLLEEIMREEFGGLPGGV